MSELKRYLYHNELLPLSEIIKRSGLSRSTVFARIRKGKPIEEPGEQSSRSYREKAEVMRRYGYKV